MNASSPMVSGFWVGDKLPLLAELCIRSYLDHGIAFQLFVYERYPNIPEGTVVRDAAEILPHAEAFEHEGGSLSLAGDLFRYTFLFKEGGFWTDMDVVCLRPSLPETTPWFALQDKENAAVGIVGFAKEDPRMALLRDLAYDPVVPAPWDTPESSDFKERRRLAVPDVRLRRKHAEWGEAGPPLFTRAMRHFELFESAAPPSSIYPIHWSVWRWAFDGSLNLNDSRLKDSWAVHLWFELLRREPDAWHNISVNSIVWKLFERHFPSSAFSKIVAGCPRKKTRIVVGICSSLVHAERRQAVRSTWLARPAKEVQCLFFVGMGTGSCAEERDLVQVKACDSYDRLPEKVLAFFKYALRHYDFEWLFKCDDDTYLAPERLFSLIDPAYDLIGDISLAQRGAPSGGAGYLLSRSLVEKIVATPDIDPTGPEDIIYGNLAAKLGARTFATPRLCLDYSRYPRVDNDQVSAHWCSPAQLGAIDTVWTGTPCFTLIGAHEHWTDEVAFYDNGIFARKTSGCSGKWRLNDDSDLTLTWFAWGENRLEKNADGFVSKTLKLTRPGALSSESVHAVHGVFIGKHPHWHDKVILFSDGTFRRCMTSCRGRWNEDPDTGLTLNWNDWGPEILHRHGSGYAKDDFSLMPLNPE